MKHLDFKYERTVIAGALGRIASTFKALSDLIAIDQNKQIETYWFGIRDIGKGKKWDGTKIVEWHVQIVHDKMNLSDDVVSIKRMEVLPGQALNKSDEWLAEIKPTLHEIKDYPARLFLPKQTYRVALAYTDFRQKSPHEARLLFKSLQDSNPFPIEAFAEETIECYPSEFKKLRVKWKKEKAKSFSKREYAKTGATIVKPQDKKPESSPVFSEGDVIYCSDADGTHTALLMSMKGDVADVLFLTSSSQWNPYSRKLTSDEEKFFGMPIRRTTYFAPVPYYSMKEIYSSKIRYPEERFKELKNEFKDGFR